MKGLFGYPNGIGKPFFIVEEVFDGAKTCINGHIFYLLQRELLRYLHVDVFILVEMDGFA